MGLSVFGLVISYIFALIEANIVMSIINWPIIKFIIPVLFGINVSVGSLTSLFFLMNLVSGIGKWVGVAKGTAEGWWQKLFGHSKYLSWGMFLVIVSILRIKGVSFGFSLPGIVSWLTDWIRLSHKGYVLIISFTKEYIIWGYIVLVAGIIFVVLSQWQNYKFKKMQRGEAVNFPMLGWTKESGAKKGAARRTGMETALYATIGDLAPLVEHEYKAVVMKIHELEKMQEKGRRVPMDVLLKLRQSKKDIENKIITRVINEGGIYDPYLNEKAAEMSQTIKDAALIQERLMRSEVFPHLVRTTLPGAKKFEKKKNIETGRGASNEKPKGK